MIGKTDSFIGGMQGAKDTEAMLSHKMNISYIADINV